MDPLGEQQNAWLLWCGLTASAAVFSQSCATTAETTVRNRLVHRQQSGEHEMVSQASRDLAAIDTSGGKHPAASEANSLGQYVALALRKNPRLKAAFEQWRASVLSISRARRLPDPVLSFGVFLRSVETRVGPQLARISLQQAFPWPTRLSAGADSASASAKALEAQLDAQALGVAERVADQYWQLWLVRKTRAVHQQHLQVLKGLSETVLARVSVGQATLAEPQQVALASARTEDMLRALDERERSVAAALAAEIGEPRREALPTPDEPAEAVLPEESTEVLHAAAEHHPLIHTFDFQADAERSRADAEEASRYPSFMLGADWIVVGQSAMNPAPTGNGKDAVMLGAGMSLPLWQGSYSESADAARAAAISREAQSRAAADQAFARVEQSLAKVRDARRRVLLYTNTLVPQADAALASVLGAYVTGRGAIADALRIQEQLLDLKIQLERARADHARSWAQLEEVVGRPVTPQQSIEASPAVSKRATDSLTSRPDDAVPPAAATQSASPAPPAKTTQP